MIADIAGILGLALGIYLLLRKDGQKERIEKLEEETPKVSHGGDKVDAVLSWKGKIIYEKLKDKK